MNRETLKQIMAKHAWSMESVALIAEVSPHAVRAWLRPVSSKASRCMREHAAALIAAADARAETKPLAKRLGKNLTALAQAAKPRRAGKAQKSA